MINEHRFMWRGALAALALLAGCTKPNPLSCADGLCSDPAFPFCDVNGEVEGEAGTCVAVSCAPDAVAGCRGDFAITCNAAGDNFDLVECARGCEDGTGCRLCDPNETVCTNGTVATCDAAGTVVSSQACPLGCFEDEPRCRDIDPSNNLGQFLDVSSMSPDLTLPNGGQIFTDTGVVLDDANQMIPVTTALIPAPAGGAPIRVIVANHVSFGGTVQVGLQNPTSTGPALAIVANNDIVIGGTLSLWSDPSDGRSTITAGGVDIPACTGGVGQLLEHSNPQQQLAAASGGGGHATAGGDGGQVDPLLASGAGGGALGSATLVPLRGGCAGGAVFPGPIKSATFGGGAVQLTSRTRIELTPTAVINANGINGGVQEQGPQAEQGAGAGGGILLEAPVVELGSATRLLVNGGAGPGGNDVFGTVSLTSAQAIGGACTSTASFRCSSGGNGASLDGPATSGAAVPYTNSPTVTSFRTGGGGGGLGFIRINTRTGEHTKSSDTIESGVVTTSVAGTR